MCINNNKVFPFNLWLDHGNFFYMEYTYIEIRIPALDIARF